MVPGVDDAVIVCVSVCLYMSMCVCRERERESQLLDNTSSVERSLFGLSFCDISNQQIDKVKI